MIVVIIAGGSGTRLWPLSTPEYPKHLLKINGDNLSLVQQTYERAKRLTDKIYVVTETGHQELIKAQLPKLKDEEFIVEPARRGTASCIVSALVRIEKKHGQTEPIVFLSADHYVRDTLGFNHSFKAAVKIFEQEQRIVLIGIEPDYPATGFGYIKKGKLISDSSLVFNVDSFREKPDFDTAKSYLKSGSYLWNCGYFTGSVEGFKKAMKSYAPKLFDDYQKLAKATSKNYDKVYLGFETISIDYALIEKVKDLLVVQASFDWMDLGSFGDLHKAVGNDELGNHIHGGVELEEVENSYIHNLEDKPIAVVGLDNVVIVNTPDGILVARKDLAQQIGEVSKRLKK